jgi:hypothetical protein
MCKYIRVVVSKKDGLKFVKRVLGKHLFSHYITVLFFSKDINHQRKGFDRYSYTV